MTDRPSVKGEVKKQREARLAAELRENLKKRKAQARTRLGTAVKLAKEDR